MKDIRKWVVRSGNCRDYVVNKFDVTTVVEDSAGFQYGNGKCGVLTLEGYTYSYDLRYCKGDLHMAMIEMYFGKNLVDAVDVTNRDRYKAYIKETTGKKAQGLIVGQFDSLDDAVKYTEKYLDQNGHYQALMDDGYIDFIRIKDRLTGKYVHTIYERGN